MSRTYQQLARSMVLACAASLVCSATSVAEAAGPGLHGYVYGHSEDGKLLGPVANAELTFTGQTGRKIEVKTNERGYYRIQAAPGVYYYEIRADGYRDEDEGRGLKLMLSDGYAVEHFGLFRGEDDDQPVKPPVKEGGILKGRVVEVDQQGKERGVPAATITLRRGKSLDLMRVVTRRSGSGEPLPDDRPQAADRHRVGDFKIALPAGTWKLSATAKGYDNTVHENTELGADETVQRKIVLRRAAPDAPKSQGIRGAVTLLDPGGFVQEEPEVIDVAITPIGKVARSVERIELTADADGSFQENLPKGMYIVAARAEGFRPRASSPVLVASGTFARADLTLVPVPPEPDKRQPVTPRPEPPTDIPVSVQVIKLYPDDHEEPLAGAKVGLFKIERGKSAEGNRRLKGQGEAQQTSQDGFARFEAEDEGRYVVAAYVEELGVLDERFEVSAGQKNAVVLRFPVRDEPRPSLPSVETQVVNIYKGRETGVPGTVLRWYRTDRKGVETLRKIMSTFGRMDSNNDGRVLGKELAENGHDPSELLPRYDTSGDAAIDLREFAQPVLEKVAVESPRTVRSTEQGHVRLKDAMPGEYLVSIDAPEGYIDHANPYTVLPEDGFDEKIIVHRLRKPKQPKPQLASVSTRVVNRSKGGETGVPGVVLRWYHADVNAVEFLREATEKFGHRDSNKDGRITGKEFAENGADPTVMLPRYDKSGDAAVDLREYVPLGKVVTNSPHTVRSQEEGRVELDNIAAGDYLVSIDAPDGYVDLIIPYQVRFDPVSQKKIYVNRSREPSRPLEFTVVARNAKSGKPIPGVDIVWRGEEGELERGRTNEFGMFQQQVDEPGQYTVAASKDGFESAGDRFDVEQDSENRFVLRLESVAPGDSPRPEAEQPREPIVIDKPRVDVTTYVVYRDGDRVVGVPRASVTWTEVDSAKTRARTLINYFHYLDIDDNDRLRTSGKEAYEVFRGDDAWDLNDDGYFDEKEFISGVRFADSKPFVQSTRSGSRGVIRLQDVPLGRYTIRVDAPSGYRDTTVDSYLVSRGAKYKYIYLERLEAEPEPPRMGLVTIQVEDADGEPMRPARIGVRRVGRRGFQRMDRRLSTGLYEVELEPGRYEVVASREGYRARTPEVEVVAGGKLRGVVTLTPEPSEPREVPLYVRVLDERGRLITDARVTVAAGPDLLPVQRMRDGLYRAQAGPGTYKVNAFKEGYQSGSAQRVTIAQSDRGETVNVRLTRETTPQPTQPYIAVSVIDNRGRAVDGASVTVAQGRRKARVLAGGNGGYIARVEPGRWNVSASKSGYLASGVEQVTVNRGEKAESVTLHLSRRKVADPDGRDDKPLGKATLTIKVLNYAGKPLPGAEVTFTTQRGATSTHKTGRTGRISLPTAPGTYTVKVDAPSHNAKTLRVTVGRTNVTKTVRLEYDLR